MNTSESIIKIAPALVEVQEELVAVKDSKNPHFKNGYASLDCILDSIKPAMRKHGLVALQTTRGGQGEVICVTRVIHSSGEWIESECAIPIEKNTPQGFGSSLTYSRRYGLATSLGIGTMDDDDGTMAEESAKKKQVAQHFKRNKGKAVARFLELNISSVVSAFAKSKIELEDEESFGTDQGKIEHLVGRVPDEATLIKIGKMAVELDKQEKATEPEEPVKEDEAGNEEPAEEKEPAKKKAPAKKAPAKKAPAKKAPAKKADPKPEKEEEKAEKTEAPPAEAPSDADPTAEDGFIEKEGPNGKLAANKPVDHEPEDGEICDEVYVKYVVDYYRKNVENTITEEMLAEYIEKDSTEWDYDARTGLISLLKSLMKSEVTLHEAFPSHYAE